ncbi:MAG: ferritin-like domain-containing protein [Actinomycetota bacterium]|nr:ferritin-like domain-containing protein [Actinomycetota bacterium]
MDVEEFDLDRYLRASGRVDLSAVAWDRVGEHPLSGVETRCLAYMMDIESHTVVYLRDLLATRAILEPDVTAFLSCWVYEELWHGEAFSRFLGEAGLRLAPERAAVGERSPFPTKVDRNRGIRHFVGRSGTLRHLAILLASAFTTDFVAVYVTWGAVNELSTLTAYQALIERTNHPILVDLLRAIVKDERRHFAFYRAQARMRLACSARARRLTRWAMEHLWDPVGTGVRPQQETDFLITSLFSDERGLAAVRRMDDTIGQLPGLEGTRLLEDARERALTRLPPCHVGVLSTTLALSRAGIVGNSS